MGIYVKKTMIGYKEVAEGEADFYIQEIGEYKKTIQEISDLRTKVKVVDRESAAAQQRQREACEKKISDLKDQAYLCIRQERDRVDEAHEQLKKAEEDVKRLKGMNADLKRITRERANQIRGITPKKQHDGYIVLRSEEWKEKWVEPVPGRSKKIVRKEADTWKSIIQTPVDASIPLEEVEDDISNGLKTMLQEMGCKGGAKTRERMQYDESWAGMNVLYRWKYRANYRSGFWEVDVYTTESLRVPEHRRPPRKVKGSKPQKRVAGAEVMYADDSDLFKSW